MLAFLIVLFVVGGLNWYLVFNERARRRWGWSSWTLFGRDENKEAGDAVAIASALIIAVLCSSVIICALIIALVGFWK